MVANDRREFQRLRLAKPILALMDGQNALILDIGIGGAFVEHYGSLPRGARCNLLFRWMGEEVEYVCQVKRSDVVRAGGDGINIVSHSGVRFVEPVGDSAILLNEMMATFVGRVLAAQRANAIGRPEAETLSLSQIGGARRARSRGYVTFHYYNGVWRREVTSSGKQPDDGFTVAAFEDDEELETLCRTYESADTEGRRLIRLLAQLSAHNALT